MHENRLLLCKNHHFASIKFREIYKNAKFTKINGREYFKQKKYKIILIIPYLRWLDKLGLAATMGVTVVMRQTYWGHNYALVDNDFNPNPVQSYSVVWGLNNDFPKV